MARGEGGVDGEGRRVEARRMAASAAVHDDGMEQGGSGSGEMRRQRREGGTRTRNEARGSGI